MLALLFEKQSLRTRVSFEVGMTHLGGSSIMLGEDVGFGKRESVADFARVLSEMVDVIVVRAKQHATVEEVARARQLLGDQRPDRRVASVPGAGRSVHAAGALRQAGRDCKLAWVGDGNNVARSLVRGCGHLGVSLAVCTPQGYELDERRFVAEARQQFPKLESGDDARSARGGPRRGGRLHRRLGQHGPGERAGEAARRTSPTIRSTPS